MISILDYGMANLRSVQKAFAEVGHDAQIISSADQIDKTDKLVLPGVGAFRDAVATLREKELDGAIVNLIQSGKPFLGICLGLQMLFDVGLEDGEWQGLGVLKGKCVRFEVDKLYGLKVPHMGWNQLELKNPSPLFDGMQDGANVYFVHGYHVVPEDESIIAAITEYGRPFVSAITKDNIQATQFHPEKSQKVGLQILRNFAAI